MGGGRGARNDNAGMVTEGAVWDEADCDARMMAQQQQTAASVAAESAVIVDSK